LSWYSPKPRQLPKRLPRRRPIKAVPSGLGDKGIVGNWLFYNLKGGDHLHDFSPYDNHGTINGAKWKDERYGWALDFDGADDYVDCGASVMDNLSAFTLIYWIKADSWTGDFNAALRAENQVYHRFWSTTNGNRGIWIGNGSSWDVYTTDTTEPSLGKWYMCTLRWDGSTFELLYDDAVPQLSVDTSITSTGSNTNSLILACNPVSGSEYLDGRMTLVRLYSRSLSDAKISTIYNRTKGIFR